MKIILSLLLSLTLMSFSLNSCNKAQSTKTKHDDAAQKEKQVVDLSKYQKAYFAGGCFWCVEAIFESVKGVPEVISGYAGGHTKNPTYESSNTGKTGHAEAVMIYYDPAIVSFESLVTAFFSSIDPTTIDGQAPDFGSQYRTIAFYQTDEEKQVIEDHIDEISTEYNKPIATEVKKLRQFYEAEAYHQNYERLHPNQPYIKAVSIPRLNRFKKKHPELLKEDH